MFKARGITKEGKFIYGYYHKYIGTSQGTNYERHFILDNDFAPDGDECDNWCCQEEIIQEPDACLNIKDVDGKMVWENDELEIYGNDEGSFTLMKWHYDYNEYYFLAEQKDFKILGNKHGITE